MIRFRSMGACSLMLTRRALRLTVNAARPPLRPKAVMAIISGISVLCSLIPAQAGQAQERFEHGLAQCLILPVEAYETGLLFNPTGYQTYFKRARCLQRLAVEWRDPELCSNVRERRSLFFNGSAISEEACAKAVAGRISEDQGQVASIRVEDFHRLAQVRFTRSDPVANHFLLEIETQGRRAGTYQVRVEVWPSDDGPPVVIADYTQPLGVRDHSLTRSISDEWLRDLAGGQPTVSDIRVRVTLELPPRSPSDQFTLALIPVEARRSAVETRIEVPGRDHR